jgi:hypothetical protein
MQGISSGHRICNRFAQFVSNHHPGTRFVDLPLYEVIDSFVALREHVDAIIRFISKVSKSQPEVYGQGCDRHSQGALLCRCVAQE